MLSTSLGAGGACKPLRLAISHMTQKARDMELSPLDAVHGLDNTDLMSMRTAAHWAAARVRTQPTEGLTRVPKCMSDDGYNNVFRYRGKISKQLK